MRKTVLMLDIDGVLNCELMCDGYTVEQWHELSYEQRHLYRWNIKSLNMIVEKTGCDVVLSSTWRLGDGALEYTQKMLESQGFKYKLVDKTGRCCSGIRGVEVKNYLRDHPEYVEYAILDDDSDFLIEQLKSFFHVDRWVGLTPHLAHKIIDHLNGVKTSRIGGL